VECFFSFLVFLVLFLIVTGSAARAQTRRARRRRAYQQLARGFAGAYLPGGVFGRASAMLRYGDTRAWVREASGRGPLSGRCTEIAIDWPHGALRCEIMPKTRGIAPTVHWGWGEISTGDREFDSRYLVRGRDPEEVREIFREGVRWNIEKLRSLFDDDSVYILIQRARILVQKPKPLRRYEDLHEFTRCALDLFDQAMLTRANGIEFVAEDEVQPLGEVICKVCGERIVDEMVFCRRCKTPHHADCWHFAGACSVYGCGETQYLTPQPAQGSVAARAELKKSKPR
jgi:hypothetical protein